MVRCASTLFVICIAFVLHQDGNAFTYLARWVCYPEFDRCFKILLPGSVSFSGAQSACQNAGGNLVAIHSEAFNTFAYDLFSFPGIGGFGTSFWIGAFQENGSAPFEWINGSPFDYSNWFTGQPDNNNGIEHCVQYILDGNAFGTPGTWNDIPCDTELNNWILCEYPEENPQCGQRGYHVITQLTNTRGAVDWAITQGATGIQMDLQIDAEGNVGDFRHGAPCDCCCYCGLLPMFCNGTTCDSDSICAALIADSPGAPCDAGSAAVELLEYVANQTSIVTVVINSHLTDDCNTTIQTIAGQNAAQMVVDHLFQKHFPNLVIFNARYTSQITYLLAAAAIFNNYGQYGAKVAYTIAEGTGPGGELDIVGTIEAEQTIPDPPQPFNVFRNARIAYLSGTGACNPPPNPAVLYSEDTRKLAAYNEAKGVVGLSFAWTLDDHDDIVHSFRYYHGVVTSFPGRVVSLADDYDIVLAGPCTLLGGSSTDFCYHCNIIPGKTSTEIVSNTHEYECACTYHATSPTGCKISTAAPPNSACFCTKEWVGLPLLGHWKCTGTAVACRNPLSAWCASPDTSKDSCIQGFGDCSGYS